MTTTSDGKNIVHFVRDMELLPGMHNPAIILASLLDHATTELCDKYKYYGNSYANPDMSTVPFWRKRLKNEVDEYRKAITPEERKRKLANLFNLVWMAYAHELMDEGKAI